MSAVIFPPCPLKTRIGLIVAAEHNGFEFETGAVGQTINQLTTTGRGLPYHNYETEPNSRSVLYSPSGNAQEDTFNTMPFVSARNNYILHFKLIRGFSPSELGFL